MVAGEAVRVNEIGAEVVQAGQGRVSALGAYVGRMHGELRIRLGSRRSPMALAQAHQVRELLEGLGAGVEVEVVGIETSGDKWQGDLAELGGKGAFMKEIDKALITGQVDIAVHCLKDVPGDVPLGAGLVFAAYLEREDVHDALVLPVTSPYGSLAELPAGSKIGSSAVRRKAQLGQHRPDLSVHRFRGNVNSRIARLDEGAFDAVILARAGLRRIGMENRVSEILPMEYMIPAVGAGVIGIQCRGADPGIVELVRMLDHPGTRIHVTAERTMLHGLQGHCNSPIAGHAHTEPDGTLSLLGMVFTRDGGEFVRSHEWAPVEKAAELGAYVAGDLLRKGARDLIADIPH
jgi:hydroxymethylbilane synthase